MKYATAFLALAAFARAQESASAVSASAEISVQAGETLSAASTTGLAASAAQSAVPSGLPVTQNTTYGYACDAGQALSYGIVNATFSGVDLETAVAYFQQWTTSAPGEVGDTDTSDDSSMPMEGAERTYTPEGSDSSITEVLGNNTVDPQTGALHQTFNTTEAYEMMDVTVSAQYADLQVYTSDETMETTMQYFVNACTDNQEAFLAALPASLQSAVTYWSMQLSMQASGSMSMSSGMASATPAAAASASGAAGGIVSSVTGAAGGALSSVTGAPAGVLSSLTGGVGGAIPTALPTLRARGRWY